MMLSSPGTGLERVGLVRNTSIIEKLTNLTYNTLEQEDDAKLFNCLEPYSEEQDISPAIVNPTSGGSPVKKGR